MDLIHRFSVPATRDRAWSAFANVEQLAPCFPGATITSTEGDDFAGTVKVKIGPIALVYTGTGSYVERDRDRARMVIEVRGRDRRGNGTATAIVTATFVETGDHTVVEVQTDLSITGKPAQFGRGVISDVSDKLLDQFASCLSGRFAEGLGELEPEEPETTVELGQDLGDVEAVGPALTHTDSENAAAAAAERAGADRTSHAHHRLRTEPAAPGPSTPRSLPYTPPSNAAEPDVNVVATLLPVLLRRYWPVLGGAAAALFVTSKIVKRARR